MDPETLPARKRRKRHLWCTEFWQGDCGGLARHETNDKIQQASTSPEILRHSGRVLQSMRWGPHTNPSTPRIWQEQTTVAAEWQTATSNLEAVSMISHHTSLLLTARSHKKYSYINRVQHFASNEVRVQIPILVHKDTSIWLKSPQNVFRRGDEYHKQCHWKAVVDGASFDLIWNNTLGCRYTHIFIHQVQKWRNYLHISLTSEVNACEDQNIP